MKITKRQLQRIIKEEKARLNRLYRRKIAECPMGDDMDDHGSMMMPHAGPERLEPVVESESAIDAVLIEMEVAANQLTLVTESLENAEGLLERCADPVACHKPLMESLVAQVEALLETVEAESKVLKENGTLENMSHVDHLDF